MTSILKSDIANLASLSSLSLTDEEIDSLRVDAEKIITYINKLDELDVDGVEPTYQVTDLVNVYRNDEVTDGDVSREKLLELAPESVENQIKVPKVL